MENNIGITAAVEHRGKLRGCPLKNGMLYRNLTHEDIYNLVDVVTRREFVAHVEFPTDGTAIIVVDYDPNFGQ